VGREVLRFLLWRLLGLLALIAGFAVIGWFLSGGPGRALRGHAPSSPVVALGRLAARALGSSRGIWNWAPVGGLRLFAGALGLLLVSGVLVVFLRLLARHRRCYVRLRVEVYRTDHASAEAVVRMFEALHKRVLVRWWRRLIAGQPSVGLEVHHERISDSSGVGSHAWLAVTCPLDSERMVEAALRAAYPNCRLTPVAGRVQAPSAVLRLKKDGKFIERVKSLEHFEHEREPPVNRLLTAMGATRAPVFVQVALTPTPALFERLARHLYKQHEHRLSRERRAHAVALDRSMVDDAELRGGLDVQHRPLFFADVRVAAAERRTCEQVASELRSENAENKLVERGTSLRQGVLALYARRIERGEGNSLAPFRRGVFASTELASIWHLPSIDYMTVPFARAAVPLAPASPSIMRPRDGEGTLRDTIGPVSIHPELRKQNTAVPGTVEQGKSSYLVATVAEDLRRERCAVIVLDPKGDAADAAVSLVPAERTCTLLDFSHPTCGFNPLAVDAPADVIADYVVAALKNLFTDTDIKASSDRYLRNAIIAVLAYDRASTLWDAARLLSVGEEGYAYRRSVGARVRALPEFKEISEFFTAELAAQLADARSMTTAKLDAPVNKLARLLNSASIKRVLLNESLAVDFDRVIARGEVLVVKGALGAMGSGNTSVLMQLLVGMLDAALARQQDLVSEQQRIAVALKVDEAPLVLNRGFAETMALKRSAGLETVACWQSDSQWTDREVREQLDALFAHRVYFATASTRDARTAVGLTMAEFSDSVRPGIERLSALGRPDARLHLPKHHAIASWTTSTGRQAPFIARTIPLRVDRERLAGHAERQRARGGRHRTDLRQPHWQDGPRSPGSSGAQSAPAGACEQAELVAAQRPVPVAAAGHEQEISDTRTLPTIPAASYRELVDLDLAHSVRWAKRPTTAKTLDPDLLDLEMLALIERCTHVLSSQLHRHFNPQRAITTTQRRLKRLSDAGLVERFQFHRRDGGGVPMCYVISASGRELLRARDRLEGSVESDAAERTARRDDHRRLRRAGRDVHLAGWALALLRALGDAQVVLRGFEQAVLSPPQRTVPTGRVALGLAELRLPGGRTPHDFLRTDGSGEEVEIDRFETIRPDSIIEVAAAQIDLLVEFDGRVPRGPQAAKLERYDHFLAGWSVHTRRYGSRRQATPVVVFVCRDRLTARKCAGAADSILRACRAYAGEYPFDWEYPGRERTLFVAERDAHEGLLHAYGIPRMPPQVRVAEAHGDPQAGATCVELRELLPSR
jgi:hypothetical protein